MYRKILILSLVCIFMIMEVTQGVYIYKMFNKDERIVVHIEHDCPGYYEKDEVDNNGTETNEKQTVAEQSEENEVQKQTETPEVIETIEEPAQVIETTPNPTSQPEVQNTGGYSSEDMLWLAKIIHAEARGESYEGKVAVGNVVINRVKASNFPNTIKGVIFQKGQFQPVRNGSVYNQPGEESIRAANESITRNIVGDSIYFYEPATATDTWIRTRTKVVDIGNHRFAK